MEPSKVSMTIFIGLLLNMICNALDMASNTDLIISLGGDFPLVTYVAGFRSLISFFGNPLWGNAADIIGRRKVMLYNSAGLAIGFFITVIWKNLYVTILAKLIQGCFLSLPIAVMAHLSDVVTPAELPGKLGLAGAMISIGIVLAAPFGGVLATYFGNFAPPFVSSIISALNFVILYFFLKDVPPKEISLQNSNINKDMTLKRIPSDSKENTHKKIPSKEMPLKNNSSKDITHKKIPSKEIPLKKVSSKTLPNKKSLTNIFQTYQNIFSLLRSPSLAPILLLRTICELSVGLVNLTNLELLRVFPVLGFSVQQRGFILMVLAVLATVMVSNVKFLVRLCKGREDYALVVGYALSAVCASLLPFSNSSTMFLILLGFYAMMTSWEHTIFNGIASQRSPPSQRGLVMSYGESMVALGGVVGPLLTGILLPINVVLPSLVNLVLIVLGLTLFVMYFDPNVVITSKVEKT